MEYVHTDSDIMFMQPGPVAMPGEESNRLWQVTWDILDKAQEFSTEHRDEIPEGRSLKEWLTDYLENQVQSTDPKGENYLEDDVKKLVPGLAMYWADENAIPLEKVSMKWMDAEDIFPGDHSIVINGFDRVIKVVSAGLKSNIRVLLEHVVNKIEYEGKFISSITLPNEYILFCMHYILNPLHLFFFNTETEVRVSTSQGIFTADKVLCTLPLGVLKSSHSSLFHPQLPAPKQQAISRLGFGTMYKIFLFFPTCFWPLHKHFINFLPSSLTIPSTELVQHFGLNEKQVEALTVYMQDLANYSSLMPQYNIPILVGYATNRAAELMERLSDEEARMVYLCQMSHYFPILLQEEGTGKEGELVGKALWPTVSFMSRWNQDPFARGSYTSIPTGASQMDLEVFGTPVGARAYGTLCGNDDDDEENNDKEEKVRGEEKLRLKSVDDAENGRIFFAGEHTSPSRFASVHGALMTGQREAAKILGQHSF